MSTTSSPVEDVYEERLVSLGYVLAVLFAYLGVVMAVVVWRRPYPSTSKHGPWIMLVAIVFSVLQTSYFVSEGWL